MVLIIVTPQHWRQQNYHLVCLITLLCWLFLPINARAECSRPMQVPVSVSGYSVIVKGNQYTGIMPDFLGLIETKTNCRFAYFHVPKSRQEYLFESGKADLLIATIKTDRREKSGYFVPLIQLRATLISIKGHNFSIQSAKDLIDKKALKLVVVRGYDYGPVYQRIVEDMNRLGRLTIENDPISVGRTMQNNANYVTIMAPTLFVGLVQTEAILKNLIGKLRFDKLDDLPWNESGIYISKLSLSLGDQNYLRSQLEKNAMTDVILKSYANYYSPEVLKLGLRRREQPH
jgi:polar amino acid transport system substrate-binding protein